MEYWYNACLKYHRADGPAIIYYKNGQKTSEWWYRNGKLHRDDGPAVILYENGQKIREFWYRNGEYHREGRPAVIWYENDQMTYEFWYCNGKPHRDDGPAEICCKDGKKNRERWYRDGQLGGNVLAYIWLADINDHSKLHVLGRENDTLDEFRNIVKGPLALELMRPLPIPIREVIYEHYCLQ